MIFVSAVKVFLFLFLSYLQCRTKYLEQSEKSKNKQGQKALNLLFHNFRLSLPKFLLLQERPATRLCIHPNFKFSWCLLVSYVVRQLVRQLAYKVWWPRLSENSSFSLYVFNNDLGFRLKNALLYLGKEISIAKKHYQQRWKLSNGNLCSRRVKPWLHKTVKLPTFSATWLLFISVESLKKCFEGIKMSRNEVWRSLGTGYYYYYHYYMRILTFKLSGSVFLSKI